MHNKDKQVRTKQHTFPTDQSPPVRSSFPLVAWPILVLRLYIITYNQGTRDCHDMEIFQYISLVVKFMK